MPLRYTSVVGRKMFLLIRYICNGIGPIHEFTATCFEMTMKKLPAYVDKVVQDYISQLNKIEPKNISFSKDKLAFEGFSKGKSVVAMMVELEHR